MTAVNVSFEKLKSRKEKLEYSRSSFMISVAFL